MKSISKYENSGKKIGALVDKKQVAYGNSFGLSREFLELLYPNGLAPEDYEDALCLIRIFDKMKRIATQKEAFGENPYNDIAGYALLGSLLEKNFKGDDINAK